jgi:curli biogenesis system outer membrane secretion channel CsgG
MIFGVAQLVAYVSRFMTLNPGDIITTGTPPGVGMGMKPPQFLKAGDVMRWASRAWASSARRCLRSSFGRGIFADGGDRLGSQSKTILVSHLQQSNRFSVLDRENMAESRQEAALRQTAQAIRGADYLITGAVSEFGRKEVGDRALFGLLGRGKTQVAYAKVTLNIVNPLTSEVVYSVQGGGEYTLSEREILGFGSTASYDATLNGKVLDLAIREAVDRLVAGLDSGSWKPAKP